MTARPNPTWVYHITRLEHLPSMIEHGIWSDRLASERSLTTISVAHGHIKARRAQRRVPVGPGGTLADYVPFYFAPRSPMLYAIHKGNVANHNSDCTRIVYLVTSVQQLRQRGHIVVGSDRHAVMSYARFTADDSELTGFVDWALMEQRLWFDVPEYPDRSERRQAELLVHEHVAWDSIQGVATRTEAVNIEVRRLIEASGRSTRTAAKPEWYF
ncbi:type II toxin-antitoxin system toxin DNA ADP-ribosyl transferase DarT [Nocardia asiatica]|uniref:type II toxin-antitoxin system toxin DNA ADP-ribosyl transferase DarT n=1 Tax=Nocardia asiatica TaxID=209252 RepID=UPI0005BE3F55|nr:DUF4433 domain-containing protein [Nocardia asiatica]